MSVKSVQLTDNKSNYNYGVKKQANQKQVAFTGFNPVVGLMDFIDKGGYATSFILQDGLGFVVPRVGKGLLRGGKEKTDENGNVVYDRKGNPKHELNWEYGRKEGIRELITGPSAFLIPLGLMAGVKKYFGRANNVKLDYLDGLSKHFAEFASDNLQAVADGTPNKADFYNKVFEDAIKTSINDNLPEAERLSSGELKKIASEFTDVQLKVEAINADKSLTKEVRAEKLAQIGTVEERYAKLRKGKIGGVVNDMRLEFQTSKGKTAGSIGEMIGSMADYYDDAMKSLKKVLKDGMTGEQVEKVVKNFTNRRMGSRILTNLGMFTAVALFFTQIPKLYNMGLKGNPALKGTQAEVADTVDVENNKASGKDVSFGGLGSALGKAGKSVYNGKASKAVSDIFEMNGSVISGTAMPVLLYGFCIPPRLKHAQDKYDYGEIVVRDLTSFTALLFGAKALARGFSDWFTKITGLALNRKNMEGRNAVQKVFDYLNPHDTRHAVLSTADLTRKYTNIDEYKGGVNGFMEFIEKSGGNVKKAFSMDKEVQSSVEEILKDFNGKSFKNSTAEEIKEALKSAHSAKTKSIEKFYNLFKKENGLLRKAKTCNSAFGFMSTLVLVPGLIMWLTNVCEKMTKNRTEKDFAELKAKQSRKFVTELLPSNTPTMAGFLNKN